MHEVPDVLWRAYEEREYALLFAQQGRVRIHALEYYKNVEGSVRRDTSEGDGHIQVPGDVPFVTIDTDTMEFVGEGTNPGRFNYQTTFVNPTYILCLSMAGQEELSAFGPHIVEVFQPRKFLDAFMEAVVGIDDGGLVGYVEAFPVRYDKGEVFSRPENLSERMRISYGQKPRSFQHEAEFRVVVALNCGRETAPEYLDLVLPEPSSYARLLG